MSRECYKRYGIMRLHGSQDSKQFKYWGYRNSIVKISICKNKTPQLIARTRQEIKIMTAIAVFDQQFGLLIIKRQKL